MTIAVGSTLSQKDRDAPVEPTAELLAVDSSERAASDGIRTRVLLAACFLVLS